MEYITIKRFKRNGIGGRFNIPYGTTLEMKDGFLLHEGRPVCKPKTAMIHEYFARNDDGNGIERGNLSHAIIEVLGEVRETPKAPDGSDESDETKKTDERWERILQDELAQKYRRPEHADYWLWNDDFFNAPIDDLKYLMALTSTEGD